MTHLTQTSHVAMTQIIDGLQFETRPYPLRNFRVAKSTLFLFSIVLCTLRFIHMQSLAAYFFLLAGNENHHSLDKKPHRTRFTVTKVQPIYRIHDFATQVSVGRFQKIAFK